MNVLEWPRKPGNTLMPWWVIGWRVLLMGPLLVAACLMSFVVLLGWGRYAAKDVWELVR